MQSRSLSITLVISLSVLLLAAIAIIPIYHEAIAKDCNNSDNGHDSSCSDKQSSDPNSNDDDHNNKHSNSDGDGNSAKKDKTPFVLAQPMPFP